MLALLRSAPHSARSRLALVLYGDAVVACALNRVRKDWPDAVFSDPVVGAVDLHRFVVLMRDLSTPMCARRSFTIGVVRNRKRYLVMPMEHITNLEAAEQGVSHG